MLHVPASSAARAYDRFTRLRIAALMAALQLAALPLAACGGGGTAAGVPPPELLGTFVLPATDLALPVGARFPVRVTGLPPNAPVVVLLDADGLVNTTGDSYALQGPVVASSTGEVVVDASTDGAPEGTFHLLAVRSGTTEALAVAADEVEVVSGGALTFLGGPADEALTRVARLADGRVAVAGTLAGTGTYDTTTGPVTLTGNAPLDAMVAVFQGDQLVGAHAIAGSWEEWTYGLAAAPDGNFVVIGASTDVPSPGGPLETPAEPPGDNSIVGYLATYDDDADFENGLVAYGVDSDPVPARDLEATGLAIGPDGSRWVALASFAEFAVGGEHFTLPLSGGTVIARFDRTGQMTGHFAAARGFVRIVALHVLADGDLMVAGTAEGAVVFGVGLPSERTFEGGPGLPFVARYAPDGTFERIATADGPERCDVLDMGVGPAGNVFLVGRAFGPTTFGPGVAIDPGDSLCEGFVAAFSPQLTALWSDAWTTAGAPPPAIPLYSQCASVVALPDGGCAVVGLTVGSATVHGTSFGSEAAIDWDSAVARYAADGALEWLLAIGGPRDQQALGVASDEAGCLLVAGSTVGPITFTDRDGVVTVRPSVDENSADGFLLRLDPDGRVR